MDLKYTVERLLVISACDNPTFRFEYHILFASSLEIQALQWISEV